MAVAALALLVGLLPRALPGPGRAQADAPGRTLVVMSANLRFGDGDPAAVLRLVREHEVDVLSLQELTPDALRRLDAGGLGRLLPQRAARPDTNWSGLGVMARAPLRALPGPRAGAVARVLLGDFDATLDHREMQRLLARGYADAADATGAGLRPTWPTTGGRPPLTIDHVLFPRPILVRLVSLHTIPGSDHRALIAELVRP